MCSWVKDFHFYRAAVVSSKGWLEVVNTWLSDYGIGVCVDSRGSESAPPLHHYQKGGPYCVLYIFDTVESQPLYSEKCGGSLIVKVVANLTRP